LQLLICIDVVGLIHVVVVLLDQSFNSFSAYTNMQGITTWWQGNVLLDAFTSLHCNWPCCSVAHYLLLLEILGHVLTWWLPILVWFMQPGKCN